MPSTAKIVEDSHEDKPGYETNATASLSKWRLDGSFVFMSISCLLQRIFYNLLDDLFVDISDLQTKADQQGQITDVFIRLGMPSE